MSNPFESIEVLVEPELQKKATQSTGTRRRGTSFAGGKFLFTHTGSRGGEIKPIAQGSQTPMAGAHVVVFNYAPRRGKLNEARTLVSRHQFSGHSLFAVASPDVFNQPEFRAILVENNIRYLVEEPDKFEIDHLLPWLTKLTEQLAQGKSKASQAAPTAPTAPTAAPMPNDPLDISVLIRDPESGRLDAQKISKLFGLTATALAKLCQVSKQALGQNSTSTGIQDKLHPLEEVAEGLLWCGGDQAKFRAWLNRPNSDFPKIEKKVPTPMDLILRGHAGIVAAKLHNLRTGHPA